MSLPDTNRTAIEASREFHRVSRMETVGSTVAALPAAAPSLARPNAKVVITRGRLRMWGWLSALSLVDQGLASGAGFGVNLLLARWMMPDVYGAFAVAFAGFLFVSGFHNVLLLEPMSVMGPSRHAGSLLGYFRAQMVVHAVLVGALSGVSLLGGLLLWKMVPANPLAGAVIGGSLALPFLLLAWLARRMCYVMRRPGLAIQGSAFYLGFVGAGLFVLAHFGWLEPFSAFVLMGCGSLVSAGLLLLRLELWSRGKNEAEISWSAGLAENWKYGKWLLASTVLYSTLANMFFISPCTICAKDSYHSTDSRAEPTTFVISVSTSLRLLATSWLPAFLRSGPKRLKPAAMRVSSSLGAISSPASCSVTKRL